MKKALGLRSSTGSPGSGGSGVGNGSGSGGKVVKKTVGELMRTQMKVSEAADSRIRRALLRISAGQVRFISFGSNVRVSVSVTVTGLGG